MRIVKIALLPVLLMVPVLFAQSPETKTTDQVVTRIDFVAVEASETDSRCKTRFALNLAAGVAFPKMARLSEYTSWINGTSEGDIRDIEYQGNYLGSFEYFLHPVLGIGAGYEFINAATDGTVYFMETPRRFEIDLKTHGVFGLVHTNFEVLRDRFALGIAARIGHYWSSYTESENGYLEKGDDTSLGTELTGGFLWLAGCHISVGIEAGYRWLKFGDYVVAWVSPGNPPAQADFTGPTTRAILSIRF